VNGARSFHALMQRLAAAAVLLMLFAPLISRWQQSHDLPVIDDQVLCQSEFLTAHTAHAHEEKASRHSSSGHLPTDHHEDHGIACDYCVLVARLLPLLVWLWLFPTLVCAVTPDFHLALAAPQAAYWPASHPRGPPLYC